MLRVKRGMAICAEADLDRICDEHSLDLPWVSKGEPVVRLLVLEAVLQQLPEHPILVSDPITAQHRERRRRPTHDGE